MNKHIFKALLYLFEHEWKSFHESEYNMNHIWYDAFIGLNEEVNLTSLYNAINYKLPEEEIQLEYNNTFVGLHLYGVKNFNLFLKNETKN